MMASTAPTKQVISKEQRAEVTQKVIATTPRRTSETTIPTLKLEECPFSHENCQKEWHNPLTGHTIECDCPCHKEAQRKNEK